MRVREREGQGSERVGKTGKTSGLAGKSNYMGECALKMCIMLHADFSFFNVVMKSSW
jgi:hypothetical protein